MQHTKHNSQLFPSFTPINLRHSLSSSLPSSAPKLLPSERSEQPDTLKDHHTLEINTVSDHIAIPKNSFDKMFFSVSQALSNRHPDEPEWQAWSSSIVHKIEAMSDALKKESMMYHDISSKHKRNDRCVRFSQLLFTSVSIFINTSASLDATVSRMVSIAMGVLVYFSKGLDSIYNFGTQSYKHAEVALALDGLSRTLKTQLASPVQNRRDPSELILFVENTRDKMLKKLIDSN
jgi:hypothetical protein